MREADFTRKLLRALRSHAALKDAVIWKHADRFSAGVPDFSISIGIHTLWVEVKVLPNKCTKLQNYFINKLNGGACVAIAMKDGRQGWVFPASSQLPLEFDFIVEEIVRRCLDV